MPDPVNPVHKRDFLKEPRPLPRAANGAELAHLLNQIRSERNRAVFLIWLRGMVLVRPEILEEQISPLR